MAELRLATGEDMTPRASALELVGEQTTGADPGVVIAARHELQQLETRSGMPAWGWMLIGVGFLLATGLLWALLRTH